MHKYLALEDRKQDVLDMTLAGLPSREGDIPLVATVETSALTLWWWNKDRWESFTRDHAPILATVGPPNESGNWNWSRHVGLACSEDTAFLVYKRQFDKDSTATLYIDVLKRDPPSGTLISTGDPVAVPLFPTPSSITPSQPPSHQIPFVLDPPFAGFELWAGYLPNTKSLLILSQIFRTDGHIHDAYHPYLTFLSASVDSDLSDFGSWKFLEVDAGGFDLDVRLVDTTLSAVYRRTAASLVLDVSHVNRLGPFVGVVIPPGADPANPSRGAGDDSLYSPLCFATVEASQFQVLTIEESLPGGEHPQIQSLDPLFITCDRTQDGSVLFNLAATGGLEGAVVAISSPPFFKVLLRKNANGQWVRGRLLTSPSGLLPRGLESLADAQQQFELVEPQLSYSTLWNLLPLRLLRHREVREKKGESLDILLHSSALGALIVERFTVSQDQGELLCNSEGLTVWDINHTQVGDPTVPVPPAQAENTQFLPVQKQSLVTHTQGFALRQRWTFDNTIGGGLSADASDPAHFFSYTDPGDGGGRVIFDSTISVPEPHAPPDVKQLQPEMVPGPGGDSTLWVELPAPEWRASNLEQYPAKYNDFLRQVTGAAADFLALLFGYFTEQVSLGFRLQALLDYIPLGAASIGLQPTNGTLDLGQDQVNEIQSDISASMPRSQSVKSGSDQLFQIGFSFLPGMLMASAGDLAQFTATAQNPPGGSATFHWEFSDDGSTADGAQVTHVFTTDGVFDVSLIATAADGSVSQMTQHLTVSPSLWTGIWKAHQNLGDGENYAVRTATISFAQYSFTFKVDGAGRPDRVSLTLLPKLDTQYRFRGSAPGQGLIDYKFRFRFDTSDVKMLGILANIVKVNSLHITFSYCRGFNPAILSSDRRSVDPVLMEGYDDRAHELGLNLPPGGFDVETVQNRDRMTAAALAAKPLGKTNITVEAITPDLGVADGVKIWILVSALVALGLTPVLVPLLTLLLIPIIGSAVVGLTLGALIAILVAAGLALIFVQIIAPWLLRNFVADQVRATLTGPDFIGRLDDQFFMMYAGEGLAEALAIKALDQARSQGVDLPDTDAIGRRRFRAQFWQTVFVSDGRMRILVKK